jgi:hypothetical protein
VRRLWPVAGAVVALAGLVVRFCATTPLWLDEALSVNIARLPYDALFQALRHDGSPPLYYLLLHCWIGAFGDGPAAARALSAVLSVLAVPAAWAFAREVSGSRRVAWVTALLVATSPFAMRYGAEARMYALVQLLVALGGWALARFLRRPTALSGAAVAACSGLLALTHYWAFYLLGVVGLGLLLRRRWRAAVAVAAGGVLFVPWLPSFAYQLAHTGTPWAPRPPLNAVVDAMAEWSGGGPVARLLFLLLLGLAALGLLGAGVDGRRVELDLRGRPLGRRLAAVTFGTLLVGVLAGIVLHSGYAARYTAVVVVPFLLLVATGTAALLDDRVRTGVVGAVALLGVVVGVPLSLKPRTEAGVVAAALRGAVGEHDVVAYCPDQLGPAVARLLPAATPQVVYPTGERPGLVDWVDYAARNDAADPLAFARGLLADHPDGTIWLVVAGGYRTFGDDCEEVAERLRAARVEEPVVRPRGRYGERAALVRFEP